MAQDTKTDELTAARLRGSFLLDFLGIVGIVLVCIGAWLIFPPAAFIVLGLTSVAVAIVGSR